MITYNQKTVDGSSWERAKRIVFENPYQDEKMVKFIEERITTVGDRFINESIGSLTITLKDSEAFEQVIEMIDPTTGEKTGKTVTFNELHAILFSTYIQLKKAQDMATAPDETVEEDASVPEEPTEQTA